jgi:2'-5' RNA ligase
MYFMAIVLPSHLNEKAAHWKNYMFEKYKCKVGLKSPAHITLIPPFWMEEMQEQIFLNNIDTIATTLSPFIIKCNNFSAFKPRTIFIDVHPNEQLIKLKAAVDSFFKKSDFKIKLDRRPFHPHITIATRDLFKKSFYEAWPFFAEQKFEEEWQVNSLSVLRHNKKNWDVIATSQFKS